MGRRPASNVVVIARCPGTKQEVISDGEGKFKFSDLPQGVYEVSAETHADPSGKGVGRRLSTKKPVRLVENNGIVTLHLYKELIAVKGRITDVQGRSVAGACVTGTPVPVREVGLIEKVVTVSGADGSYTLYGFAPMDVYRLAGYLNGGNLSAPGSLYACVEVCVVADGFIQNKSNVPNVPLVSDELLDAARRFGKSLPNSNGLKSKDGWREKDSVFLPVTDGNTILNVDVVLNLAPGTNGVIPTIDK